MQGGEKILILGGTREAADLAEKLVSQGHQVTTSLAGRTKEPKPLSGETRIGGYSTPGVSGVEGLVQYLTQNGFDRLIDATHPFATKISQNAREAARLCGIAFEHHQREPWAKTPEDRWIKVAKLDEAVDAIPAEARVLLALGSQHISVFARRADVFFLVRMVDQPDRPLDLPRHKLVLGKPAMDPQSEEKLLLAEEITHVVCRNSGGEGAYAKIIAARNLQLPVIMISG